MSMFSDVFSSLAGWISGTGLGVATGTDDASVLGSSETEASALLSLGMGAATGAGGSSAGTDSASIGWSSCCRIISARKLIICPIIHTRISAYLC